MGVRRSISVSLILEMLFSISPMFLVISLKIQCLKILLQLRITEEFLKTNLSKQYSVVAKISHNYWTVVEVIEIKE